MSEYQLYLNLGGIRYKVKKPKVYKLTINFYEDNVLNNTITKTYASGTTISPTSIATEYLPTDYEVDTTSPTSDFAITEDTTLSVYYKAQSTGSYVLTFPENLLIYKAFSYESPNPENPGDPEAIKSPYNIKGNEILYIANLSINGTQTELLPNILQINGKNVEYDTMAEWNQILIEPKSNVNITLGTESNPNDSLLSWLLMFNPPTLNGYTFRFNDVINLENMTYNGWLEWIPINYDGVMDAIMLFYANNGITKFTSNNETFNYIEISGANSEITITYDGTVVYDNGWIDASYKNIKFIQVENTEYPYSLQVLKVLFMLPFLGTLTKN